MKPIRNQHSGKIVIVGAGNVGAAIAYALTVSRLAHEIVLIDVNAKKAEGEALDIQHGIPFMGASAVYVGDYTDCADSDLIIITAGRGRKPGETRLNLIADNYQIMRGVIDSIQPYYTRGKIMVVSNPVDILTYYCTKWMALPDGQVLGTGCMLDTSRIVRCVSDYLTLSTEMIKGFVVGEHGDAQVPIWSGFTVAGMHIADYCENVGIRWSEQDQTDIALRVRSIGAEIISGKGFTNYGIATCVCSLADAILNQRLIIAPVCTILTGEYGIEDVALSIPSIVGAKGVERRLQEKWSADEIALVRRSADKLRDVRSNLP